MANTSAPFRLGTLVGDTWVAHQYPGLWDVERTSGPDRLVLAPAGNYVSLLKELSSAMKGPFGLLHVLLVSRSGREPGRYQSSGTLEADELQAFLTDFAPYLESDGRHHTWIFGLGDEQQVIYDNHNLIYCYGDLARFQSIAENAGLKRGAICIPAPHSHQYNDAFDRAEDRLFECMDWTHFPLHPDDDP